MFPLIEMVEKYVVYPLTYVFVPEVLVFLTAPLHEDFTEECFFEVYSFVDSLILNEYIRVARFCDNSVTASQAVLFVIYLHVYLSVNVYLQMHKRFTTI